MSTVIERKSCEINYVIIVREKGKHFVASLLFRGRIIDGNIRRCSQFSFSYFVFLYLGKLHRNRHHSLLKTCFFCMIFVLWNTICFVYGRKQNFFQQIIPLYVSLSWRIFEYRVFKIRFLLFRVVFPMSPRSSVTSQRLCSFACHFDPSFLLHFFLVIMDIEISSWLFIT